MRHRSYSRVWALAQDRRRRRHPTVSFHDTDPTRPRHLTRRPSPSPLPFRWISSHFVPPPSPSSITLVPVTRSSRHRKSACIKNPGVECEGDTWHTCDCPPPDSRPQRLLLSLPLTLKSVAGNMCPVLEGESRMRGEDDEEEHGTRFEG